MKSHDLAVVELRLESAEEQEAFEAPVFGLLGFGLVADRTDVLELQRFGLYFRVEKTLEGFDVRYN